MKLTSERERKTRPPGQDWILPPPKTERSNRSEQKRGYAEDQEPIQRQGREEGREGGGREEAREEVKRRGREEGSEGGRKRVREKARNSPPPAALSGGTKLVIFNVVVSVITEPFWPHWWSDSPPPVLSSPSTSPPPSSSNYPLAFPPEGKRWRRHFQTGVWSGGRCRGDEAPCGSSIMAGLTVADLQTK